MSASLPTLAARDAILLLPFVVITTVRQEFRINLFKSFLNIVKNNPVFIKLYIS